MLRSDRPASWASADASADGAADASWAGRLDDPRFAERITAAMDARGRFLGPALTRATAELPMRRMLDIGGGSGAYLSAIAEQLSVTGAVFERAPVDAAARTLLTARGQAGRIDVITGDMSTDPLPAAEYSVLLMHGTTGKCWSTSELTEMLTDTGFAMVTCRPTAADRSAIIARKPA